MQVGIFDKKLIKILGIFSSYDKRLVGKDDFYSLILDCRSSLNTWKQRWLSLVRRIQVFKSLVVSKHVYVSTMIIVQIIFAKLYSLWKKILSGVGNRIKHSTLIWDYQLGGLMDVDIPSKIFSLKFSWIKSLKDKNNFHPWKKVATQLLLSVGGE